ncbi:MAG: hypothetical protein KF785_01655 [Gemmatimonadales bacterium]|nr:hypothetical protein [Gemmatimonadales bacterium]
MLSTALPLRIDATGSLVRQDDFDAVLGLISAMAGTTSTTWPHARWFGLFEAFTDAGRRQQQDHETLKDAINLALRELGVEQFRVQSVTTVRSDHGFGHRHFRITMTDALGRSRFAELDSDGRRAPTESAP